MKVCDGMCSACGIAGASDGVGARRRQRLVRQRRRVVGVDDVVRQAGMLRHLLEERLEDVGRLQILRVGLVGRRRGLRDRERVEDLRLGVVRVGGATAASIAAS